MSKSPFRLPLAHATALANKIKDELSPVCEVVEIVGSVRRKKDTVGDIELICVPRFARAMFGLEGQSLLDVKLNSLIHQGRLIRANKGAVNPRFVLAGVKQKYGHDFMLDLVISSPERLPIETAIKTGSAAFSWGLVTPQPAGYLPKGYLIKNGWQLWHEESLVKLESERDFIELCLGRWVAPEERN